jgi:hypothetical protein
VILALVGLGLAAELQGVVRERGTGDPLASALVQVGEETVTTDVRGRFVLEVPEGTWTVEVFAPDHEAFAWTVELPLDEPIQVFLPRAEPAHEIVVEAELDQPHVSAQVLDKERVQKAPGNFDDPVRLLQSLPGVATTPEYSPTAGAVVLRGAAPAESRYFLDGVEIPYLFHFQQYSSVFHTGLLDGLAMYPSTFGAGYGNTMGGVVEASSARPDPARLHGGATLNMIMGGAWVTAPVGEDGGVSMSARRSFYDVLGFDDAQYTLWPRFYDYLGRYDQDIGEGGHHLAVTGFGAGDAYSRYLGDTAVLNPLERDTGGEFSYDRAFHALSLRLDSSLDGAQLRSSVALVRDRWGGEAGSASQEMLEHYVWLRHDALIGDPEGTLRVALGGQLKQEWLGLASDLDRSIPELEAEAPLFSRGLVLDESHRRLQGGVYVEPRLDLGSFRIQPGLRVDADDHVGLSADPRLMLRFEPLDQLRLRAAAGRYSQAPELRELSPVVGDPSLGFGHADQVAGGVDWAVAGRLELGVDAWAKRVVGAVAQEPGQAPEAVDGQAWGVELTTRYRMRELFFAWASFSFGRAMRDDVPFDFDQPYALNLVASWDFRPHWNVGLRYRYATGLPYTPALGGRYDGDTDSYEMMPSPVNSSRLPNYSKLDVHLERAIELRRWTVTGYLEGWFVPPSSNGMYVVYSYDYSQSALVSGPVFFPIVGARVDL